ncbi:hypothetical protein GCM10020219_056260 [Nonomuraea dietziae]
MPLLAHGQPLGPHDERAVPALDRAGHPQQPGAGAEALAVDGAAQDGRLAESRRSTASCADLVDGQGSGAAPLAVRVPRGSIEIRGMATARSSCCRAAAVR